jgi:hypothetical protein
MVVLYIFIIGQISDTDTAFFDLDSVYFKYEAIYQDTNLYDSLFAPISTDTVRKDLEGLRISGTKDFSFDMNRGFDQGLKVDITGEVEGVRIEGNLTDKATPSSTMQISEVEKMSLNVFTKNFHGGIGNLTLDLPFGIQDEIQGGRVGIFTKNQENNINFSYAINRGAFARMQFQGEEGKQSPYFLEGTVIAGSERVYLAQGIARPMLLKRDQDYTVDYEQGIISFTNQNIITSRSRIEIEYQQAIEDYPNIYTETDGRSKISGLLFTGMYRRKYDEKEDPLAFTMSSAEIESLKLAGDSSTVLHTYADTSSEGNYTIEDDHFVYVGEGNGNYKITFFYLGEKNGEYTYDPAIKAFLYRGPGQGNYSPKKFVPLPANQEFYGTGVNIFETLKLNIYGSNFDRNTFSPIDDDDNIGFGYHMNLNKTVSIFSVSGEYLQYNKRLVMPQGKEGIDYRFQWNTEDPLEELGNVALGVNPTEHLAFNLGYGILNRKHKRKFLGARPYFFFMGYEGIDTLDKYFAGFVKKQGKFALNSQYENFETSHLFNYGIKYSVNENVAVGVTGSFDRDTTSRGITTIFGLTTSPLTLSLGHRLYNDTTFLFGNAGINIYYKGTSFLGNLEQSQRYSQKRDETYTRVDEGSGNYVYDPVTGTYIEKEGGDYIKKIFLLPEYERVVSRNYNIEVGYTKSIFDLKGKFNYIDEKDFLTNSNDLLVGIGDDVYDLELNVRQDITEDARYALDKTSSRERLFAFLPHYRKLIGRGEIREYKERFGGFEREKRNSYDGEIGYSIILQPLLRPKIGYLYSKLYSQYFSALDIRLRAPRTGLLLEIPIKKKGRVALSGELIQRIYNIDAVPYFFSATEPPGLTKIFRATVSIGLGTNTILSFIYRIEFPPEEKLRHNLRFQTRIRF